MAQTIEELAEILKTLKLDNEINSEETEKVLLSINSKMESIADDYAANQLLKDYLVDLRQELAARHDFNVSKYGEFEKAFSIINNEQQQALKPSDLDELLNKVNANIETIRNTYLNKSNENLENITTGLDKLNSSLDKVNDDVSKKIAFNFDTMRDLIENITQDIAKQHEKLRSEKQDTDIKTEQDIQGISKDIRSLGEELFLQSNNYKELLELKTSELRDFINTNSSALAAAQVSSENKLTEKLLLIESLNHGFESNIIDVNNNLQSILQSLMSMDPTAQNDIIKRELENIYITSNGMLSAFQIFEQKNDEIAKMISQLVTNENFDKSQQKIDDILSRINDLNSHISEMNFTFDFDTIAARIGTLSSVIDEVKSLLNDVNIDEQINSRFDELNKRFSNIITEDDFNAFRADLTDFIEKIVDNSNFLNKNIEENKEKIEQILNNLQSFNVLDKLNDIAVSVEEIASNNIETITAGMGDVSAKLDKISSDFRQKADENVENLSGSINVVSTKLDFVHNYLANDVPANFNTIKEMNEDLHNFVGELSEFYKSAGVVFEDKVATKLFELEKSFVENVDKYYEKLSDLKADSENFNQEFVEVLNNKTDDISCSLDPVKESLQALIDCDLSAKLVELKELLNELYSNTGTHMQMTLNQNQTLVESLEKLYHDTIDKIDFVNETLNSQAQNNLEMIKSAMEDINNRVSANLNGNSHIIEELKTILGEVEEKIVQLSSSCAGALSNIAVDVTNALNVKLESVLEDLKDYLGAPVSANDLVLTVDNLKNEFGLKLAELANKQSTKEEDAGVKGEILVVLNQLELKIDELSLRYSNDEFNEILGNNKTQLMVGLKDLKNIILIAMKEVAKSSSESMDVMHEKLDTLLENNSELFSQVNNITAKSDEILEKISNISEGTVLETTEALMSISGRTDNIIAANEKNSETLGSINEKIDGMSYNGEQIANSLVNIAEKFSGLRQNSEQLVNEIQSVNETVETINIRGENVSSTIGDISEKASNIEQKAEDITDKINNISNKIDTFSSSDERITHTLDLISDKLDNNENNEHLTQGMQYLNEKMDLLNENGDRISRTVDVVLDKIETFSDSDDDISNSLNSINEKIETISADSEKIIDHVEGLCSKVETFGEKTSEIIGKTENISSVTDQITSVLNDVSQNAAKIENIGETVDQVADCTKNLSAAIDNVSEQIDRNDKDVRQSLAEFGQKFDDFAFNDGTIVKTMEVLSDKIDVFKFNTNNDQIVSSLDSLHEKVADCYASEEKLSETLNSMSDKMDSFTAVDDSIHDTLTDLSDRLVGNFNSNSDNIIDKLQNVDDKVVDLGVSVENLLSSGDQIENTLQLLQDKVVALSEKDVLGFDVESEIKNIKSMLSTQRKYLEDTEISERTIAMDDCLQDLQKKIDDIAKNAIDLNDLDINAGEIKESLMAAIANVFDQISFIEETEEIKGFVEEKTDEISKHIKDVQYQLRQIASNSGDDDYSYSLQDVESDIAKLRLVLNEISDAAPNAELSQLSDNVSKIENTVKDLQTTLTQEEFARFKDDFNKINEDIVSISNRTNALLLNSDNSYKSLNDGLNAFKGMVKNLNNKINYLDNTEIQKRIEKNISNINNAMISSANSNKVIREVLMYLGEWMDTTSENINSLSEKTCEIDRVHSEIDGVRTTINELKNYVPEKSDLLKTLENKFENQEERIDRLEMKLEKVLAALEETDDTKLNKKVDKIEKLINKLNDNVEKLTSYVDEE